jgi:hypothetical protein
MRAVSFSFTIIERQLYPLWAAARRDILDIVASELQDLSQ